MTELNARQRSLIASNESRTAGQLYAASREAERRAAPVTGTVSGYDATTGDYLISTPDGGTLRTQSLTDGSLVGLRLPVQRFGDSQTSTVDARPAQGGAVDATTVETAQRDTVALLGVETLDFRIEAPEDTTYVLAPYQHYAVRVEALQGVSGGTVVTTPALGTVAEVGTEISITISASTGPVLGSILLRRVG